ncbi:hypothetical protein A6V36_03025 [Paraburkholderia ginsengiterrae]|uniref:Uncharacterized protein n=1 Tax=Paraburkholderia ginsengiterrae TaxID=1462993 RepID=A0A1A9NDW1_9BURK|nr:hypothetical protein [Paraburkholderia ginsengiterrae]OAJ60777.1 hypothetical protein A6V36_03025 [Paraburkholderia ginsengiterrae]OAJ64334.1 hypothetical protein A6V37_02225 [Paraburkholderia ginsengiterrae]
MARRPTPALIAQRFHLAIWTVEIPDSPAPADFYIRTYQQYVAHFARVTVARAWDEEQVVDGLHKVYTWMKRATKFEVDRTIARELAAELNKTELDVARLTYLASRVVNNSMVGGSKFLHFYAPTHFPITDSWLQLLSGKPHSSAYALDFYRDYLDGVRLVDAADANRALEWATAFFGYEVSEVRAIEAVAFYLLKGGWHHDGSAPQSTRGNGVCHCHHSRDLSGV